MCETAHPVASAKHGVVLVARKSNSDLVLKVSIIPLLDFAIINTHNLPNCIFLHA